MATKIITLLLLSLFLSGCFPVADESGLFWVNDNVDERFEQSMEWNLAHPARVITLDTETYQLLVAGDTHVGNSTNFMKLLAKAKQPDYTGFVVVGDVTDGTQANYDTLMQTLQTADSVASFFTIGNHDLFFDGWQLFFDNLGPSVYTLTVVTPAHKDLYIFLDTGSGTLGEKQYTWVKRLLEQQRDQYNNCVVVTHINFFRNHFTTSTNPTVEEVTALLDLFARTHVNLVITGHDHELYENEFGNTTYVCLEVVHEAREHPTYLVLTVKDHVMGYHYERL